MEIFQRDEIAKAISTPATLAATRGNSARGCTVVDDLRRSVISQQMPELVQDDVLSVQWTRRVLEEHIVRTRHYKPETARAESGLVFTREDGRTLRHEYISRHFHHPHNARPALLRRSLLHTQRDHLRGLGVGDFGELVTRLVAKAEISSLTGATSGPERHTVLIHLLPREPRSRLRRRRAG
jgi:hypothetical protein